MIIKSDSVKNIAQALCKAQAEMPNAEMNSTNPHFKNRYADLVSVREAILGPLNKHGLAITQIPHLTEHGFALVTVLMHAESGEYIGGAYPLPIDERAQQIGASITYARRYSAAGIPFISADEDDDGNMAQQSPPPSQARRAPPKPANDNNLVAFQKLEPQKLPQARSSIDWGVQFSAQVNAANTRDEVAAWVDLNMETIKTLQPEQIKNRVIQVIDNRLSEIDQQPTNNKTDTRKPGAAKSAADDLDSYRAALLAANTQAELDKVWNEHPYAKKHKDSAMTMYQTREARLKAQAQPAA